MCTDKQCQRVPCLLDRIEKLEATVAQLSNNKTIQMYQYTKPEPPLKKPEPPREFTGLSPAAEIELLHPHKKPEPPRKKPSATIFDVTDAEMYLIRDGRTVQDIIDLRAKKSATSWGFIA